MDDNAEVSRRKRRAEWDTGLGAHGSEEGREGGKLEEEVEKGREGDEAGSVRSPGESKSKRPFELGAREVIGLPEDSGPGTKGEAEVKEIFGNNKVTESEARTPTSNYVCPTSVAELSPISVTPVSSISGPIFSGKELSLLNMNEVVKPKREKNGSAQIKALTVKTTVPDGYTWRKYGQKQVKSPKGSRSYYRCTFSECCAKKIERSDDSGHVIELVNKGRHSHDAPIKSSSIRERRIAVSPRPGTSGMSEKKATVTPIPDPPCSLKEPLAENIIIPESKQQSSSSTESADYNIQIQEDDSVGPEPKRRVKKGCSASLDHIDESGKKPKVIVYATADMAVSGDGYRWRKYGQKMVKGNSHPRNYYRCTSAGCPMRKHIETAVDNSNGGVIITYKGDHDHVKPVPKKRHGVRSSPLVVAAALPAPASTNSVQLKKTDTHEVTSTQWSLGKDGEITSETLDVKGEKDKTIESARTLLSIGFEIKQC